MVIAERKTADGSQMSIEQTTFSYYQDRTNTSSHGRATFADEIKRLTLDELKNTELFEYLLTNVRYHNRTIYDHKNLRIDGWDYDHPEGNHAPDEILIKPFLWQVNNVDCGIKVDVSVENNLHHISLAANLIVDPGVVVDDNDEPIEVPYDIAQHATQILDFNALGILQMLSHFVDKNVFSGTRRVWVDDANIVSQCHPDHITLDPCRHVECPEFEHCVNGECVPHELCPGDCFYGFRWNFEKDWCEPIHCPPGLIRHPITNQCVNNLDDRCLIGTRRNPDWNPDDENAIRCIPDGCPEGWYWNTGRLVNEYGLVFPRGTNPPHIDTGIVTKGALRMVVDMLTPLGTTANTGAFGGRSIANTNTQQFTFWSHISDTARSDFNTQRQTISSTDVPLGERLMIDKNRNVTSVSRDNGKTWNVVATATPSTFVSNPPINIHIGNISQGTTWNGFAGTIFSAKIYDDDVLVRDFMPVPQGSTRYSVTPAPSNCMWDKVSQSYFTNAGTGSGTLGIVSSPIIVAGCVPIPPLNCQPPYPPKPKDEVDHCGAGIVYNWNDNTSGSNPCSWVESITVIPSCGLRLVRDPVTCDCIADPCIPPIDGCPAGTVWRPQLCTCYPVDEPFDEFTDCRPDDQYEVSVNFYYCDPDIGPMRVGERPCAGGHTCDSAVYKLILADHNLNILDEAIVNLNNTGHNDLAPSGFMNDRPGGTASAMLPVGSRDFRIRYECMCRISPDEPAINTELCRIEHISTPDGCHNDITSAHVVVRRIRDGKMIGWFVDSVSSKFDWQDVWTIPCR